MATGWTVQGSNPSGGEIFRTFPDWPWGPPSLLRNGYRVLPGGKERPGRDTDPSPPSSAVVMKEWSYTSTPPMGRTACTEPQCLYKGALYLTFTLPAASILEAERQLLRYLWHVDIKYWFELTWFHIPKSCNITISTLQFIFRNFPQHCYE